MKNRLFLPVFLCSMSLHAAPKFTRADMPGIGDQDTLRFLHAHSLTDNPDTETGDGYTWDFTALPFAAYPDQILIDSFRVKTAKVSKAFPNATLEEFIADGPAGDVNLFSYAGETLYIHRLGSAVAGTVFAVPLASVRFPIAFGDSSVIEAEIFHKGRVATGKRRTSFAYDGFGALMLPGGRNYADVFRVKQVERDTSYALQSVVTNTGYFWYKQGGQVPLLRIFGSGTANRYVVFGSASTDTSAAIARRKSGRP
jgi:hypothetical protein